MNSPKEKAKELFDKFMKPIDGWHKYPMCFDTAKQCAIIAVDEILNNDNNFFNTYSQNDYWLQVKQEIENL
jgi:hypothetical protein